MCEKRQDALHFSFWRDALPFDKQQQKQQQDLGDWQLGLNWSALLLPLPPYLPLFACSTHGDE